MFLFDSYEICFNDPRRNVTSSSLYRCFWNVHESLDLSQGTLAGAYTHFDYFTRLYTRSLLSALDFPRA